MRPAPAEVWPAKFQGLTNIFLSTEPKNSSKELNITLFCGKLELQLKLQLRACCTQVISSGTQFLVLNLFLCIVPSMVHWPTQVLTHGVWGTFRGEGSR